VESLIFDMHKKEVLDNKNTLDLLRNVIYENSEFSQKTMMRKLCADRNALISILEKPTYRNISGIFKANRISFTKTQIRAIRDRAVGIIGMVKTVDPFYFSSKKNSRSILIALKFARAFSLSLTKKMCTLFLMRHLRKIADGDAERHLASLGVSPKVWGEAKVILHIKNRIRATLDEAVTSGRPRYVYITGDSKVGKTTFMTLMEEAGLDDGRNRIAFINMDKAYEENDPDMELGGDAVLGLVTRKLTKEGKMLFIVDGRDSHLLNAGDPSKAFFIHITADDETRLENIIRTDFGVNALWNYSEVPEGAVSLNLSRGSRPSEAEIYSIFSDNPVVHFPKFMKVMMGAWIGSGLIMTHIFTGNALFIFEVPSVILYSVYLIIADGLDETAWRMVEKIFPSETISQLTLPDKETRETFTEKEDTNITQTVSKPFSEPDERLEMPGDGGDVPYEKELQMERIGAAEKAKTDALQISGTHDKFWTLLGNGKKYTLKDAADRLEVTSEELDAKLNTPGWRVLRQNIILEAQGTISKSSSTSTVINTNAIDRRPVADGRIYYESAANIKASFVEFFNTGKVLKAGDRLDTVVNLRASKKFIHDGAKAVYYFGIPEEKDEMVAVSFIAEEDPNIGLVVNVYRAADTYDAKTKAASKPVATFVYIPLKGRAEKVIPAAYDITCVNYGLKPIRSLDREFNGKVSITNREDGRVNGLVYVPLPELPEGLETSHQRHRPDR
ncbi:MAG TPA: hypothetical protein PKG81_07745, partial [Candidatus Omnitrophota bacterium]|nr:hypothetical protein [Candidatus Omnitrophota bacterium]